MTDLIETRERYLIRKLNRANALIVVYRDCLQKMDLYFGHGIPEVPDHLCTPESNCNMECVDYSRYTDALIKFRNVLQSSSHEASELLEKVKRYEDALKGYADESRWFSIGYLDGKYKDIWRNLEDGFKIAQEALKDT